MKSGELNEFIADFSKINGILTIVLGGSRISNFSDNQADYDIYIYLENKLNLDIRQKILSKYSTHYEINNNYWELEDNGIFKSGTNFDIIYRNLHEFETRIADVVEKHESYNGFTTCLWHNLLNSEILFDKNDIFAKVKKRFQIPYPKELIVNIIKRNMGLLSYSIISYDKQIWKSAIEKIMSI